MTITRINYPKRFILNKSRPFSSTPAAVTTVFACYRTKALKQCDFVQHCLEVSHRYVSFSAFPHDRVPPQTSSQAIHRALGTKFDMQAPGLKEEKNESNQKNYFHDVSIGAGDRRHGHDWISTVWHQ